MSAPSADVQNLAPSTVVEMWELDTTAIGGALYRFYAGVNEFGTALVWQGNTYSPLPMKVDGLEMTTKGTLPRPKIQVANLDGTITALIGPLSDLLGAQVTLKRTQAKYLDAINFVAGNPTADPTVEWASEVFYIEQKTTETRDVIEFQLVSALDVEGLMLPRRKVQATICSWVYKGTECGYGGALGTCDKSLAACKTHFGATADLPYGGFPSCARIG